MGLLQEGRWVNRCTKLGSLAGTPDNLLLKLELLSWGALKLPKDCFC